MPCNKGCENCDRICDICQTKFKIYSITFYYCDDCRNTICFSCLGLSFNITDLYELYKKDCIKHNKKVFNEVLFEEYGCTSLDPDKNTILLFENEHFYEFIENNYGCMICKKDLCKKDLCSSDNKATCIVSLRELMKYKKLEKENKRLKSFLRRRRESLV